MTRPGFVCRSAARTHVGQVRRLNEDRFLDRPDLGLWAVADGMGGHQAGEVAAGLIVDELALLTPRGSGYAYLGAVRERLRAVNGALRGRARDLRPGAVIGATVVVLLVFEGHYACVWAGDSRAYLLRDGALSQITHDHSMVQELVDAGALAAGEAARDRRANLVTRAVGASAELELDVSHGPMEAGDVMLLCSDGLTGLVEDAEIAHLISAAPIEQAADDLVALALRRGGSDNVTVVLIHAEPQD